MAPELQEDGSGTKVISISLCLLLVSSLVPQMILVTAPELQEDGSGTKVISISLCLLLVSPLVPQMILVTAPELQEDGSGTKVISIRFMSITCLSTGATNDPSSRHQNCKRIC